MLRTRNGHHDRSPEGLTDLYLLRRQVMFSPVERLAEVLSTARNP